MDNAPALVEYTLSEDDVKGPFTARSRRRMMLKVKLKYLGYASALEGCGPRRNFTSARLCCSN